MKMLFKLGSCAILLFAIVVVAGFVASKAPEQSPLTGAWQSQDGSSIHLVLFMNDYFAYTLYNKDGKEFGLTFGGTYKLENNQIVTTVEFHSENKDMVGQNVSYPFTLNNDVLTTTDDGSPLSFKRLDNGSSPLAGVWRITGRMQEGKIVPVHHTGTRKTVKILTGNRFQWVAMDPGTKEFSGTGGGTYSFADGKYTENIDFFSRDSSRVGATLRFDGSLQNDGWHHSGLSSRGDKIYEMWNKVK
ncbi:MAG TPA: hypothetical protein VFT06_05120 [Flavisolibacter sp.]|nr:hypothetical protein [Flavisolibacter sp.]